MATKSINWKYDNVLHEYQLLYQNSVLARIQTTPRKKGGVVVKSLISAIYFGYKRQEYLEKHNNEWVAYRKKFKERDLANAYINRKKDEISRFITIREKEA